MHVKYFKIKIRNKQHNFIIKINEIVFFLHFEVDTNRIIIKTKNLNLKK